MTEDQAIELSKTKFWESMSNRDVALFQLTENKLCMPFDIFHKAITHALNRPVYTHELALNREGLKKELLGEIPTPSFEDIIKLIPKEKLILVLPEESTHGKT